MVRLFLIWAFDLTLIAAGLILILKKKAIAFHVRKTAFIIVTLVLMFSVMEVFLQIAVRISPRLAQTISNPVPRHIPDETLGHRPNPEFLEHDRDGFRNPFVPKQAEIVALGDSQTYGTGVKSYQTWLRQLGKISDQPVYSMAYGGYGSVEALILLQKQALRLNPKRIVFALYDGNDLFDAYEAVYLLDIYPSLKSDDTQTIHKLTALEKKDPLLEKIKNIRSRMRSDSPGQNTENTIPQTDSIWEKVKDLKLFELFFRLELALQNVFFDKRQNEWNQISRTQTKHHGDLAIFQNKVFRTIFTPNYRSLAIDFTDPRIEEGLRITLKSLKKMKEISDNHSIDFIVLLIPTKEKVFYTLYPESDPPHPVSLRELVLKEGSRELKAPKQGCS